MKRLIIKTAAITLAAIFGVFVLGVVGMTLFAPGAMGDLCQKTGSYGLAAWYAELDYAKSKEIDKLARVIYLADLAGNDETLVEYCPQMAAHRDFSVFCKETDQAENPLYSNLGGYRTFLYSAYAEALYQTGEKTTALTVAADEVAKSGYGEVNPVRALIACAAEDDAFLGEILARLEFLTVPSGQKALEADIALLQQD